MPSYNAQTIINTAFAGLGLADPGGAPSVSDSMDALARLNLLVEQWAVQERFVWSVRTDTYALAATTKSYTIGPTGVFTPTRPTYIEQARVALAGPNPANMIESVLRLIGEQEYGAIQDKNAHANIPECLYNDRGSPNSTLYLWPVPVAASTTNLLLDTWSQLTAFSSLQSSVDLPQGYAEAMEHALELRLLPAFGATVAPEVAQAVVMLAKAAEDSIVALNAKARGLMLAPAAPVGGAR